MDNPAFVTEIYGHSDSFRGVNSKVPSFVTVVPVVTARPPAGQYESSKAQKYDSSSKAQKYDSSKAQKYDSSSKAQMYESQKAGVPADYHYHHTGLGRIGVFGFVLVSMAAIAGIIVSIICGTGHCCMRKYVCDDMDETEPVGECSMECGDHPHWGYSDENGPDCWGKCFTQCTGSTSQSPVNFESGNVNATAIDEELVLGGYEIPAAMELENNGHTVVVSLSGNNIISGLNLPGSFIADQFHFHWGKDSSKGSEHIVNGHAYPMELHIVHHHTKHADLGAAKTEFEGLAVLGFFFQVVPEDNPSYAPIVDNLEHIAYAEETKALTPEALMSFLPSELGDFYRYSGSLTTPTCDETVVWTVFTNKIEISEKQMSVFREKLHTGKEDDEHSHLLYDNFRPPQQLHGRTVHFARGPNKITNP